MYKLFVTYDMVVGTERYSKLRSVCISSKVIFCLEKQHGENLSEFMTKIIVITYLANVLYKCTRCSKSFPTSLADYSYTPPILFDQHRGIFSSC